MYTMTIIPMDNENAEEIMSIFYILYGMAKIN